MLPQPAPGLSEEIGSIGSLQERCALKVTILPFPAKLFLRGGKSVSQGCSRREKSKWSHGEQSQHPTLPYGSLSLADGAAGTEGRSC